MRLHFECSDVAIWQADSREAWKHLPERSVDAIVTSPPYFGLRDYGVDGQVGLEDNPQEFIDTLADLLTGYGERVLKPGGSLWLNLGDTYNSGPRGNKEPSTTSTLTNPKRQDEVAASSKKSLVSMVPAKCLLMIPERVALALIDRGWILRNRVVWAKPNGMPSSVRDRLATKHEALFHLVRQPRYFYDLDAIRETVDRSKRSQMIRALELAESAGLTDEHRDALRAASMDDTEQGATSRTGVNNLGTQRLVREARDALGSYWREFAYSPTGKNPGDVWTIPTQPYPDAHFAVFPPELVRRPILATVPEQVCRGCGKGRQRVTEAGDLVPTAPGSNISTTGQAGLRAGDTQAAMAGRNFATGRGNSMPRRERTPVGWLDCGCDAGWTPGTVLDPFFGSGTTGVMARRLGRKTVGVELSADYCALAAKRFRQDVLNFDSGGAA